MKVCLCLCVYVANERQYCASAYCHSHNPKSNTCAHAFNIIIDILAKYYTHENGTHGYGLNFTAAVRARAHCHRCHRVSLPNTDTDTNSIGATYSDSSVQLLFGTIFFCACINVIKTARDKKKSKNTDFIYEKRAAKEYACVCAVRCAGSCQTRASVCVCVCVFL